MKKKLLIGIAAVAMAAIVMVNVSIASQENNLSALALANVEVLAQEASECNTSCSISWEILGIKYSCSISCNGGKQAKCTIFGGCRCQGS